MREQFPHGLHKRDYVPLTLRELTAAYDTLRVGLAGELPHDPNFPTHYQHVVTGRATPLPDTPFNRAWYAAGKLFGDEAKRLSFYARVQEVMPIALGRKYAKYIDRKEGSMDVALLGAVATVRFSSRTKPKALRAAFDAELKRQVISTINIDPGARRH
jgi:hypothetical protein